MAQALANLVSLPPITRTLSLPGPSTLTYEYLLELVSSVTLRPSTRAPTIPKPIASLLARAGQAIWWPTLSPDEVTRRYIDDVDVPGDWDAVNVTPTEIEQHAITYLRRYRSAYVIIAFFLGGTDKAPQRKLCPTRRIPAQTHPCRKHARLTDFTWFNSSTTGRAGILIVVKEIDLLSELTRGGTSDWNNDRFTYVSERGP